MQCIFIQAVRAWYGLMIRCAANPRGIIGMNIQILCNRPDFLVCVKPAGLISESPGLPDLLSRQEKLQVLYPVHRLDAGTGGLMILAKNAAACTKLTGFFAGGRVRKCYYAIVESPGLPDRGSYTDFLYHDRQKNKSYLVKTLRKGVKEASCEWQKVESTEESGRRVHLVRIELHTGRTHQIRVQFASRGMPLLGDRRYGSEQKDLPLALWASGLSFPDPSDPGKNLSFSVSPPDTEPWLLFSHVFRSRSTVSDALPGQSDGFLQR